MSFARIWNRTRRAIANRLKHARPECVGSKPHRGVAGARPRIENRVQAMRGRGWLAVLTKRDFPNREQRRRRSEGRAGRRPAMSDERRLLPRPHCGHLMNAFGRGAQVLLTAAPASAPQASGRRELGCLTAIPTEDCLVAAADPAVCRSLATGTRLDAHHRAGSGAAQYIGTPRQWALPANGFGSMFCRTAWRPHQQAVWTSARGTGPDNQQVLTTICKHPRGVCHAAGEQ